MPAPDGLPYPKLEAYLKDKCNIVINPSSRTDAKIWLPISAQIYKSIEEYENLGSAVLALRSTG